ncbi:GNAT family N-acetyltransferase [Candidatus Bathyarchaeota archaeon]|nr:GNAT family N-acetyltransferase [Candidatus Bathyarchaeota archaeon]
MLNQLPSITIRPANYDDIPSIVNVRVLTLTKDKISGFSAPEWVITFTSIEELGKMWNNANQMKDGFEVYVATRNQKVVGFIVIRIEQNFGYIDNIVISRKEQGKGFGRLLVNFVEKFAKSKGCTLMKTDTTQNAIGVPWKAYGFWRKMGYQDTGKRLSIKNYDFKEIPLIKKLK